MPGALRAVVPCCACCCPFPGCCPRPASRRGLPVLSRRHQPHQAPASLSIGHERRRMGGVRAAAAASCLAGGQGRPPVRLLHARCRRRHPVPDAQRPGMAGAARGFPARLDRLLLGGQMAGRRVHRDHARPAARPGTAAGRPRCRAHGGGYRLPVSQSRRGGRRVQPRLRRGARRSTAASGTSPST
jgi:hypothetical protein